MPLATQAFAGLKPSCGRSDPVSKPSRLGRNPVLLPSVRCVLYLKFSAEGRRGLHLSHGPSLESVVLEQRPCKQCYEL